MAKLDASDSKWLLDHNGEWLSDDLDSWESIVCSNYVTVECEPVEGKPFHSTINKHQARDFDITTVSSTPIRYFRSIRGIQGDARDDLQLTFLLEGKFRVKQCGRESIVLPGEMVLYEAASPFELECPDPYKAITLKMASPLLNARLPTINDYTAIAIQTSKGVCGLVRSMVSSMAYMDSNDLSPVLEDLETPLLDVISVALQKEVIGCNSFGKGSEKLRQIQSWILKHLDNPDLCAATISAHHCISVRTLNRLFAMEGISVRNWLMRRRLDASYRLLSERRVERVTDAAFACGFGDLSHFSRAFSKAFGVSPKDIVKRQKS